MDNRIYHLLNRGVDKRKIFMNDKDRFRFIHDLFEFNNTEPAEHNNSHHFIKHRDIGCPYVKKWQKEKRKPRKLLVEILAFCLMPNHYHLLVRPKVKNGIPLFMKKINMGYAKYFNTKYERTGALFQGKYKSVDIIEHAHFLYIPYYIHLNPLGLKSSGWQTGKISDSKKAMNYLENYRWSSYLDYIGKKNFPSVTQREFLLDFYGGEKKYKKEVQKYLKETNSKRINEIKDITLE